MSENLIAQVVLMNDRDRRTLQWLRDSVGDDRVAAAIQQISGERKPYLTNICKVLGVTPPSGVRVTEAQDARKHLEVLRAALSGKIAQKK